MILLYTLLVIEVLVLLYYVLLPVTSEVKLGGHLGKISIISLVVFVTICNICMIR